MRIALMHYHLKTGGVGTVIRQQIDCIKEWAEVLVFTGEPPPATFPAETVHIPGIAYDRMLTLPLDPTRVAKAIYRAIISKWPQGCDLLHIHNPLLAKNSAYLKIIHVLHTFGLKRLLQVHDFAEDGRPEAYFDDTYPHRCAYAVINSRDYGFMRMAGAQKDSLFKLVNMVSPLPQKTGPPALSGHVLYPVRAIRRKNIGEAILLTCFFPDNTPLAITLPPNSPGDLCACDDWRRFATQHNLNVGFEMGLEHQFSDLVHGARFIISTSISEGFGFCFLEPWTAAKMLWGRRLSGICDDFEAVGLQLDHLYDQLAVPLEWIGKAALLQKWRQTMALNSDRFNQPIAADRFYRQFQDTDPNQTIDFGLLDEAFQKKIIRQILNNPADRDTLRQLNPFLKTIANLHNDRMRILHNQEKVLSVYTQSAYSRQLKACYLAAINGQVRHTIDRKTLLEAFLTPANASLLKWSPYAPC